MGQPAVDGRRVRVLPQPDVRRLRIAPRRDASRSLTPSPRRDGVPPPGCTAPSGVQKIVGIWSLRVLRASSRAQASTATTTWAEGYTSWFGSS